MDNLVRPCFRTENTTSPWKGTCVISTSPEVQSYIERRKRNQERLKPEWSLQRVKGSPCWKSKQDNGTFKHFLFFKQLREVKPAESWRERAQRRPRRGASLTRLSRWMERTLLIIYTLLMKRVTLNLLQTRYTHETLVQGKGKLIRWKTYEIIAKGFLQGGGSLGGYSFWSLWNEQLGGE